MEKAPVSVIFLTFNEEANLQAALDSVKGWASEVFVLDSYSTDRTVDIALEQPEGNIKVVQHRWKSFADQQNWAMDRLPISQPWILLMAADERTPEAFAKEVREKTTDPRTDEDAFMVDLRYYFMGKWLRWGGRNAWVIRLCRKEAGRYEEREMNEKFILKGKRGMIHSPMEHHDYKDLGYWIDRHNRYSALEARELIKGNVTGAITPRLFGQPEQRRLWFRKLSYKLPARPLFVFLYRYFFRLGFLDGKAGFRFLLLHALYYYWISLKFSEYRRTGVLPEVAYPARGAPHPLVAASELQRLVDGSLSSEALAKTNC